MEKTQDLSNLVKNTIEQINTAVRYVRRQNYYDFFIEEQQILEQMSGILSLCAQLKLEEMLLQLQQTLIKIMNAKENGDYILTADYYELLLLPVLQQLLKIGKQWEKEKDYWSLNKDILEEYYPELYQKISQISIETTQKDKKYLLEETTSGDITLLLNGVRKKVYFHSNNNPKEEARNLAEALYEKCNTVYHLLGLGLGYLPEAFLTLDTSSRLVVYEHDLNMIKLMCVCRDCRALLKNKRIELVYDKEYRLFLPHLQEGHAIFHEPSLYNIDNDILFAKMNGYYMTIQTAINQRRRMEENFTCNLLHKDETVEVLAEKIKGKTVYLVAGGPSLDRCLEILKNKSEDEKIVCVGTSLKKLSAAGILPDYVIVTDPMPWMAEQLEENETIPLWYLSTCYYGVRNAVKKGFLILQQGYRAAEEYGKAQGFHLFGTGGSVTTTALDILLYMNCKKILCLGMDMAFTDNKSHASGTAGERKIEKTQFDHLIPVKGVGGDTLYTPKNLNIYRNWIEHRIKREKTVELVNISDGAYIEGMNNITTEKWKETARGV